MTIVVTGAASGIGRAVALRLAESGAAVLGLDKNSDGLKGLDHPDIEGRCLDISKADEVARFAGSLPGPVSGLVNAAGVLETGELLDPEFPLESLRRLLAVNVEGMWLLTRALAPRIETGGAVVNVVSNAASTPRKRLGAYCASKAAALMMSRCLGLELAERGIRVNSVSPGSTRTPMLEASLGPKGLQGVLEGDLANHRLGIPLGRVAEARDVAEVVRFLLSPEARHVTLQDIRVDGGATL